MYAALRKTHSWVRNKSLQHSLVTFPITIFTLKPSGPDQWARQWLQTKRDKSHGTLSSARPLKWGGAWAQNGCRATVVRLGLMHNVAGGWRKVSDPRTTQLTPSAQQKNRGIMQTGQAGAIRQRLDGLNFGDAQDDAMDVAALVALRKSLVRRICCFI